MLTPYAEEIIGHH